MLRDKLWVFVSRISPPLTKVDSIHNTYSVIIQREVLLWKETKRNGHVKFYINFILKYIVRAHWLSQFKQVCNQEVYRAVNIYAYIS